MQDTSSEKRLAVMEAALDLFVEQGFHGAPTSLIAQRAGVGVGTIYRYFSSKDDLIHHIFDELHRKLHERVSEKQEDGATIRERLTRLLEQLLVIFMESPKEFRFLEQYHYSPFAGTGRREIPDEEHNSLRRLLREGRDGGLFKEAPIPVLEGFALGPVVFLAKEHMAGRLSMDEGLARIATRACWDALAK
jgi:AcrR family transcriptional regulator